MKRKRRKCHRQRRTKTENAAAEDPPDCDKSNLRDSETVQLNHQDTGATSSRQLVWTMHWRKYCDTVCTGCKGPYLVEYTFYSVFSFQLRRQQYIMNDTYRQQPQSQHSADKHSRMNHVPRASSTGRIRSNTTTPTAAATVLSAITPMVPQPAPGTATTMKTAETVSCSNPVGGGESSGCKPASNDSNPAIFSSNFNG